MSRRGDDDVAWLTFFGGDDDGGRPGRHRGGNLHGDPKAKATGKHASAKPLTAKAMRAAARAARKGGKP